MVFLILQKGVHMQEPETLSVAIEKLNKKGYTEDFQAKNNLLYGIKHRQSFEPGALIVDEIVRFEGETDLQDESAIFALRDSTSGIRGTYVIAYGTDMDEADMDIVKKLKVKGTCNSNSFKTS